MILLLDNYDSFTYNLVQLLGGFTPEIQVVRNDGCTIEDIKQMAPKAIVLSPGPGKPSEAGICEEVVKTFGKTIPLLGVCLGHQAICESYGGNIGYARQVMHGKQSRVEIDNESPLFQGMETEILVARYHSLAAVEVPEELKVVAKTADGEVMAVEHREHPVFGVQFHPESILTPRGEAIVRNFLRKGGMLDD